MHWQEYYSYPSIWKAMYETIGNYHQREYAIFNRQRGMIRWLYLPEGFYSASYKIQFKCVSPDTYYYSTSHLDWKNSDCYYKLWYPNFRDPAARNAIKQKCNKSFPSMVLGFDCAIDVDSHDKSASIPENVRRAGVLTEKVADYFDSIEVDYILSYTGRGFGFRIPWDNSLLELGSPFEIRDIMQYWIEDIKHNIGEYEGAALDNIMNQDKRVTKVPYSLITYFDDAGNVCLSTYAKRITREEVDEFKIPDSLPKSKEHLRFARKFDYSGLIDELKKVQ